VDRISKEHRSWNMSRIKGKDTKPELIVRSLLHRMGYRFRLNGKVSKKYYPKGVLPGKPDIVLAKYKTVVFVHGCFWHRHEGCKDATIPKTRTDWWLAKLNGNVERDNKYQQKLKENGWKVITVWECETNLSEDKLYNRLRTELKQISF
jgi:DNA mismatch endonuclease (patch repair protein)